MRDLIVVLPGITGSVLRKNGRDVWALSAQGILGALRTLGDSFDALRLREDPVDVDDLGDGVSADRLMEDVHVVPGLWKIDGYTTIVRRLIGDFDLRPGENFFEFPYDWRRDNRVAARRLARATHGWLTRWREVSAQPDARLVLIAHSMGGLVCRHFLEVLEGWKVTRRLITFGTPYRGSLNALGFLANGMVKKLGPINLVDLSQLLRSFTSVYQLLPIYPCVDVGGGPLQRVAEAQAPLPNVDAERARRALQFHRDIEAAVAANRRDERYLREGYSIHPVVGTHQPTWLSARLAAGRIELQRDYPGLAMDGDGTVPRVSAVPIELSGQQRECFVAESHGSLQNFGPVLVQVQGLLASDGTNWDVFRDPLPAKVALALEDAYAAGETVTIRARCLDVKPAPELSATVTATDGSHEPFRAKLRPGADGWAQIEMPPPAAGTYRVQVGITGQSPSVSDVFVAGEAQT